VAIAESSRNQDEMDIVGIHWHEGGSTAASARADQALPSLAIAFENGTVQLSRSDDDQNPIIFHSDLKLRSCKWNPAGSVLALSGNTVPPADGQNDQNFKSLTMLKFYDRQGNLLRAMRIPGEDIAALTWEGSGLRIALAVDSFIYFANVRPAYSWCYFLNTVAYCYQRREPTVQFWNLTTGEMHPKPIPGGVHFLLACGDHCVIVTSEPKAKSTTAVEPGEGEEKDEHSTSSAAANKNKKLQYVIQLRNGIGALVATKVIPFAPKYVAMSANQVAASNDRTLYTWQFQSAVTKSGLANATRGSAFDNDDDTAAAAGGGGYSGAAGAGKERMIDVDSVHGAQAQAPETYRMIMDPSSDPISCICSSDRHLMVARRSGSITRLLLPHLSAENVYQVRGEPFRMELSCLSSKLAVIDAAGVMQVIDLEARAVAGEGEVEDPGGMQAAFGRKIGGDKRDVWDIKWAEDNDDLLCIMEKTKMTVLRGEVAEDPVISSGYLARFRDLEVRAVLLDEILLSPDKPERDFIVDFETKALRELRDVIGQSGLEVGYNYATKNPHSRLYRILAEQSLEALELTMAEKSFVKIGDYHGVQLVKLLRSMADKMKMKAEVAAYLQHFAEAESIYRDIDRKDLAVQVGYYYYYYCYYYYFYY
jgi:WD repeat-containing protein 35